MDSLWAVGRRRLSALLVGVSALAALLAPASAMAGTFSWSLPNDFTASSPGSNPEHKYGAVSWTYKADGTALSHFSTSLDGGAGWTDGKGENVAVTGGQVEIDAASSHTTAITWTNPFPSSQTVKVSNTFTSLCPLGTLRQSPSGSSVTLAPGKSISVTLTAPPVLLKCMAEGAIQISASTPGPTVTLNSPGTAPLTTSTLTLSGTASTGFSDASQVSVDIYTGTDTTATPIRKLTGAVGGGGQFAVQASALPDGRYTAVASQTSGAGTGRSPAVTFRIKVHPPALTLDRPPGKAWIGRADLSFSGDAGDALGDSSTVTVYLYSGKNVGQLAGKRTVDVHGASWSTHWSKLQLGYYTVVAVQSDDAGHTTRTAPHTFRVVSRTSAFGPKVTVAGSAASIPIGCLAPSSQSCRGTVLVVTKRSFRASSGGPSGPLEVMFANVRIPGGTMETISGKVPGQVLKVLRRLRHVQVTVTSKLSRSGRRSASRVLQVT